MKLFKKDLNLFLNACELPQEERNNLFCRLKFLDLYIE